MSRNSGQSQQHPNDPDVNAQRAPSLQSDGSKKNELQIVQIPAERRNYLAKQYGHTAEQIDVIRTQICPSASDAELEFFLATCKRVKLDPFARQIYFIKRSVKIEDQWGNGRYEMVGKPETSIDGLRASAEQTGDYEGQAPLQWCGSDGEWKDVWLSAEPPLAAKATIFRKGHREPIVNVALLSEFRPVYKNGNTPEMWRKMPSNQLAKCAEAGGFRRGFPRDLSGLYIDVEMEQQSAAASFVVPEAAPSKVIDVTAKVLESPSSKSAESSKPETYSLELAVEIDQITDTLLRDVAAAKSRSDLQTAGRAITTAKKKTDPTSRAIVERVEPELKKRWQALPVK